MKTTKSTFLTCAMGLFLLGTVTAARAQSTWDYTISDAGGGNSLVTWSVTGTLATPPGGVLIMPESSLAVSVIAPGIYADTYSADGTAEGLATPDGSYFQFDGGDVYFPVVQYATDTELADGSESFGLVSPLPPIKGGLVGDLLYNPGTESVVIPVSFSDFNPGTYESTEFVFSTPFTVELTVVPEPAMFALVAVWVLGMAVVRRRVRKTPGRAK
jgi:hypothetical protein